MSISRDEVTRIARLARLALDPAEVEGLARDLGQILDYMQVLAALEEGAGTAAPGSDALPPRMREDVVVPSLPVEAALAPAADHDGACFRVPAVLDRGEDG